MRTLEETAQLREIGPRAGADLVVEYGLDREDVLAGGSDCIARCDQGRYLRAAERAFDRRLFGLCLTLGGRLLAGSEVEVAEAERAEAARFDDRRRAQPAEITGRIAQRCDHVDPHR